MASRKSKSWRSSVRAAASHLFAPLAGSGRGLFGIAILAIMFLAAGYIGWAKWGGAIRQRSQYRLTAESFEITPQPTWIESDVKADVMRDGRLAKLSALDPDLTKNVVQAFELNTWVAKVLWAGKRPGAEGLRVIVKLRYREPIIMVWTVHKDFDGDCFYPVDTEGITLPTDEFSRNQTRDYLRVHAGNTSPAGAAGTSFGDPAVTGAAGIATQIGPAWQSMGLRWIVIRKDMRAEVGQPLEATYVLLPSGGVPGKVAQHRGGQSTSSLDTGQTSLEVFWGRAPGRERPDEATAAQKIVRLQLFVKQNGSLDRLPATTIVDLRPNAAISVIDRRATFQPASETR